MNTKLPIWNDGPWKLALRSWGCLLSGIFYRWIMAKSLHQYCLHWFFSTFDTIHSGMQKSNAFDLRSKIFLRSNGSKYHLCDHLLRTFIHRLGRLVRHFCDIIGICFWVCADFVCKFRFCCHFHFHFDVGRADIVRVGWWDISVALLASTFCFLGSLFPMGLSTKWLNGVKTHYQRKHLLWWLMRELYVPVNH